MGVSQINLKINVRFIFEDQRFMTKELTPKTRDLRTKTKYLVKTNALQTENLKTREQGSKSS